jgi:alanyl-tRNA synthetase
VNEVVFENRSLSVAFQQASDAADLRKPSEREGELRIVSIDGLDRSACGGTHVRSTGEIGPVLLRKLDKVRGNVRIEFLCGIRAVRRARADYDALSAISRSFSSPLDETPALVAAQIERLHDSERALRKAASELAGLRGKELYGSTQPDGSGVRRVVQTIPKGAVDDELRALAQGFTSRPGGIFVAVIEDPPVLLLAASKGDGLHAGETLKKILAETGGRGGGNEQMAQASFPSRDALDAAVAALTR